MILLLSQVFFEKIFKKFYQRLLNVETYNSFDMIKLIKCLYYFFYIRKE